MARPVIFYIPREIGDFFRVAMIPEFPSLFGNNPGDVFQDSYSCDNFFVHVQIPNDVETLDEAGLLVEDLKFIDSRFQQSIGNWLMDKQARSGENEIAGKLDKEKEYKCMNFKSNNLQICGNVLYLSWEDMSNEDTRELKKAP